MAKPKIKPEPDSIDRFLDITGWALLIILWALVLGKFRQLPDKIPAHFDLSGRPDRFDSKGTIFILPLMGTVFYSVLSFLNKFPHVFNYTVRITEENARRQYLNATKMLRYTKLIIVILFTDIAMATISAASNPSMNMSKWFTPVLFTLVGLLLLIIIYFIVRSIRLR